MAKVIAITGGGRGIGAATAILAAKAGYDVGFSFQSNRDSADAVAEDIRGLGRRVVAVQADMSNDDDVRRFFAAIDNELGPLDVLINNAAITGPVARLSDVDIDEVRKVMALNVTGLILCCQEAVLRMARSRGGQGGRIVNVSSRASTLGGANEWLHYAASKGAVDSFTKGLAEEVAPEGIRVNGVSPGVIETDMQAPGRVDRLTDKIPLGRAGAAEEVAEAIIWLASDKASYVAGCTLPVTGGR